jgi:hypothetical protein
MMVDIKRDFWDPLSELSDYIDTDLLSENVTRRLMVSWSMTSVGTLGEL